ncbi:MAG: hypothetical protein NTX22_17715 [Ignavibacteriales bacterium]|nr:hypothetical protein [Ignavibacteriales bacterium]
MKKTHNNPCTLILLIIVSFFSLVACNNSQPTPPSLSPDENTGTIEFSGLKWKIKESNVPVGPGGNYFSGSKEDVWVDASGKLHMKISLKDDVWACTEIYTVVPVSYGTYIFYLSSRVDSLDPNAVLGLFTWNNNSSQTDANSEIDIEISRWTDPTAKNLHYSVQPVFGPDVPSGRYSERNYQKYMQLKDIYSTHTFIWTDTLVSFASFYGNEISTQQQIATWKYSNTNPARHTIIEGHKSDAIKIPKPGTETNLRINLWLVSGSNGYGKPPLYKKDVEVVIDKVEYFPNGK